MGPGGGKPVGLGGGGGPGGISVGLVGGGEPGGGDFL